MRYIYVSKDVEDMCRARGAGTHRLVYTHKRGEHHGRTPHERRDNCLNPGSDTNDFFDFEGAHSKLDVVSDFYDTGLASMAILPIQEQI